jgi:hypothetical protein
MIGLGEAAVPKQTQNAVVGELESLGISSARPSSGFVSWLKKMGVVAAAATAWSGEKAEAQVGPEPIYLSDPRLMKQVVTQSGVVATNYYIPAELGPDGKPVIHTTSTIGLPLDPAKRVGGTEVSTIGLATSGLYVQTTGPVAITAAKKQLLIKTFPSGFFDHTPGGFAWFQYMVSNNTLTNTPSVPGERESRADRSYQVVMFGPSDATQTARSTSPEFADATMRWLLLDSAKNRYQMEFEFPSSIIVDRASPTGNYEIFSCPATGQQKGDNNIDGRVEYQVASLPAGVKGFGWATDLPGTFSWLVDSALRHAPTLPPYTSDAQAVSYYKLVQVFPVPDPVKETWTADARRIQGITYTDGTFTITLSAEFRYRFLEGTLDLNSPWTFLSRIPEKVEGETRKAISFTAEQVKAPFNIPEGEPPPRQVFFRVAELPTDEE